jgi:hypothetical protein
MILDRAEEIKVIKIGRLNGTKHHKSAPELILLDGKTDKVDYRGTK